jgi:hypothetical protein
VGQCWGSSQQVAAGRWQFDTPIEGNASSSRAGELAPARLDISLSDWTAQHLLELRLALTVLTGQALPGQALVLRHADERLQEVTLGGLHDNEANFDVTLSRDACGTPCVFSLHLSSPTAESDVPVPLTLRGTLFAFVDANRETLSCAEQQWSVVITNAP